MAETHHFDAKSIYDFKDYVAVVTGGGTGIGLMITQALAANGAKVYITGRRSEAIGNAAESHDPHQRGQIIPLTTTDVTSKDELEKCVQDLQKREKYINLLVANAGASSPKAVPEHDDAGKLKDTLWNGESVEDWDDTFRTNVTSVYFTTVAFLPLLQAGMKPTGPLDRFGPSVIVTSSMSGIMRHAQGHFAYNASKAGTIHLTKLMSAEFQKAGIRVNSIAPGYFPSEMTTKTSDERQKSNLEPGKVAEKGHVPAERGGSELEMGMTAMFIARNHYLNGQIIVVDGGVLNVVGGA
ncbi:Carbonyl reductase family member 4 [Sphaceloma murrayae]|uniref:Carbonyl reductase family member 4 n=1 Tax=Sphaceloma murrayae TaxID=2082308 RepID=A0A2K1QIA5_9PEZI|nr:Carbonyl reductase family member 4 [Sphaceloma murrayae]